MRSLFLILALISSPLAAQIPKPTDAPAPLAPAASAKAATLPPGFRIELLAAEPLVREPSGMCWDERGHLFVCELHGYNLEGQYDIDELNKTGKLDRVVRRVQADPKFVEAAKQGQYGTVKLLTDSKGDGVLDKVTVFADHLPASYGIVPARKGIIVIGSPDITYLADRDGDGIAEVREVLYTGFTHELMERRINGPVWGPDGWIYVGRGGGGGTITGPFLKSPVVLPNTDFRIKADGTAIEPISGSTKTIGMAMTGLGDRYVISTATPALFVPPIDWRYLARNPFAAASMPEININTDQRCYPTSEAHPWRKIRAEDPGFGKFYEKRYGVTESAANGYFTSLCSNMVYRDTALPGLKGQLFGCEPAQNLITRGILGRKDGLPTFHRVPGEEAREFLASKDIWFHPIALATAPDGSIVIADYYREIIEDYSAIPRYLQQQYGLMNGENHGRVWRITHKDQLKTPPADMSKLTAEQLANEVASPHQWRRDTARRLLLEQQNHTAVKTLLTLSPEDPESLLNVLYTLDGLGELKSSQVEPLLAHTNPALRVQGLHFAERWLNHSPSLLEKCLAMASDTDPAVVLQLALTLGESRDPRVLPLLARLARERGKQKWLSNAILSSLAGRAGGMLCELIREPARIGEAAVLLGPLAGGVAARHDSTELSEVLVALGQLSDPKLLKDCIYGLKQSIKKPIPIVLSDEAKAALKQIAAHPQVEIRASGEYLLVALKLETTQQRTSRLAAATQTMNDHQATANARSAAVAQLAFERDADVTAILLAAVPSSTPPLRDAILNALFAQRDRQIMTLEALEAKKFPASLLTALQRAALLDSPDALIRDRAKLIFQSLTTVSDETVRQYVAALANKRDIVRGGQVFRDKCAVCHQAHGYGVAVGPNLSSEFQRAEEIIIKDILAPSAVISPGFSTYSVETAAGEVFNGVLAAESASSVTLRIAEGKEQVILRRDIERIKALGTSLMPDDLTKTLTPQDVADVIAWLRNPPSKVMLLDENPAILKAFNDDKGQASFITTDKFTGTMSLQVTPLQVVATKIPGWDFRIRKDPGPGEYRYLRFAWKTVAGDGVLIELAADGKWPLAKSPTRRYFSGKNTSGWQATPVSDKPPREWTLVTVDLWKDFGDFKLTGFAPTAMGGPALFDSIELLRADDAAPKGK
ncbi:hypothetical protein BH11PLA2_BH11PLA2_22280 [soil metagenome]